MLRGILRLTWPLDVLWCLVFSRSRGPELFVDGQSKGLRPWTRCSSAVGTSAATLCRAERELQGDWIEGVVGVPAWPPLGRWGEGTISSRRVCGVRPAGSLLLSAVCLEELVKRRLVKGNLGHGCGLRGA